MKNIFRSYLLRSQYLQYNNQGYFSAIKFMIVSNILSKLNFDKVYCNYGDSVSFNLISKI